MFTGRAFHLDGVFDHKSYTEKSLSRMVKARAKADRAAMRHAGVPPAPAPAFTSAQAARSIQESPAVEPESLEPHSQDGEDIAPVLPTRESTPDRTELLRSKPEVVGRFMQLMVPVLIDVYAASVITPIRIKTLTGLLKAVSFLDGDGLKRVLTVR
jgi:E3 ubiquitin-protein ligase TRIP12